MARRSRPVPAGRQALDDHPATEPYWAIVGGGPQQAQGRITLPLAKVNTPTGWRMVTTDPKGATAATRWTVLGRADGLCWLELELESGRTHQARVHCAAMGWPILGDTLYGTPHPQGLHLLARSLSLPLSPTISAIAPPRAGMRAALHACGWQEK